MHYSGFDKWLSDLHFMLANLPDVFMYSVLTVATFLFAVSFCVSLVRIFSSSVKMNIAGREDILLDKLHDAYSWSDGTYELPAKNIKKAMIYANLSYYTFWNAVIMYRYRICGMNSIYFRVNRWSDCVWLPISSAFFRMTMICSLCFIWGYPIFYVITRIRMKLYAKKKPLY